MSKKGWLGLVALSVVAIGLPSCGSESACQGAERCACYPNDTCNAGLACRSKTCVNLDATASGGASNTTLDTSACLACADKLCTDFAAACKAASGCSDSVSCLLNCGSMDAACATNCGKGLTADTAAKAVAHYGCAILQCLGECVAVAVPVSGSGGAGNSGVPLPPVTELPSNQAGTGSSSAGTANVGSAGRTGAAGHAGSSGGGNQAGSTLGIPCTSSAQCGTGMVCATANGTLFGDGGPSGGMCTKACTIGGSECDALKRGAECFNLGTDSAPKAYCLDACELGTPADLDSKCAGRSDFVCADLAPTGSPVTFCVPHCGSDAECGAGLYCDQSTILGLCKKTRRTGDPIGTACTPGAATNTCKGGCLPTSADGVTPATGVCVELCSGGGGCLYGAGANPSPGGYCGGPLSDTFGVGDLGYCLSNCSCSSDCHAPNSLCRKWTNAETSLASALGAPGVCFPTLAGSVELSCGRGGAGGTGGTGGAGGSPQKAGAGGSP